MFSSSRWGGHDWLHLIEQLVLAVHWLRTYNVDNYLTDLIAGITVGTMLIPQAMSYARLAGFILFMASIQDLSLFFPMQFLGALVS